MKSNVKFDFTKIKKRTVGARNMILTPTIHISKGGDLAFYCINVADTPYFRVAQTGNLIGLEFSEKAYNNSFTSRQKGSSYSANARSVIKEIEFEKYIGTDYHSANFVLQKESENLYWFDLTSTVTKYKKLK